MEIVLEVIEVITSGLWIAAKGIFRLLFALGTVVVLMLFLVSWHELSMELQASFVPVYPHDLVWATILAHIVTLASMLAVLASIWFFILDILKEIRKH